jgi:hypothetical protein
MRIESMGRTGRGRDMSFVVVGTDLPDASAAAVRASGKVRVWVQSGDRHSGSDDRGAVLKMLGDIVAGRHALWLSSMVLLVNPIVDADAFGRGAGPAGDTVDPTRDQVALITPEAAAFAKLFTEYDPHVSIALRTEAGPCTAYAVTYMAPLHPSVSEHILGPLRDDWFPFISKNLKSKHSLESFYRGTVEGGPDGCMAEPGVAVEAAPAPSRGGGPPPAANGRLGAAGRAGARGRSAPVPVAPPKPVEPPAWASVGHQANRRVNYVGLRNRFAIVGVTDANDTLARRTKAASAFLEEALSFVWAASTRLKKAAQDADAQPVIGRAFATRARPTTGNSIDILMSARQQPGLDAQQAAGLPSAATPVQMVDRLRFEPAADETAAAEYYLPESLTPAIDLLKKHGVIVRRLEKPTRGIEEFVATDGPVPIGGLAGRWQPATVEVPAGSWVVRMNQPLARLAFTLLEPASEDGLATVLGLSSGKGYQIFRKR